MLPALPAPDPDGAARAAARLGYPVALKPTAPHLRHRADLGAFRLDLGGERELRRAYAELTTLLGGPDELRLVVQRMAPRGVDTVVRAAIDPAAGAVLSFGLAGAPSELLGDTAHRLIPATGRDVAELIRSVRTAPLLFGWRGSRPVDTAALEELLLRVSRLVDDHPDMVAVHLEPVVVAPRGLSVLGASLRLAPRTEPRRPRPGAGAWWAGRGPAARAARRGWRQGRGCGPAWARRMGRMAKTGTTTQGLRAAIERSGYYPALVAEAVEGAVGGEPVVAFLVHQETTFDSNEVRRHVTVLVLTATRFIVSHTDEQAADDSSATPYATTSTESVKLNRISSVVLSRVVANPESYAPGMLPREVVLTIGWGAVSRLDLEPASCGDPNCEAHHCYTGSSTADDLSLRVSEAGDGPDSVRQTLAFAQALSEATTATSR